MFALKALAYQYRSCSTFNISLSVCRILNSEKFNFIQSRSKTNLPESNNNLIGDVPGTMSSRYEKFPDHCEPVVLDIEEERKKVNDLDEEHSWEDYLDVNLQRGTSGVFEVEEVVDLLRKEKARDIFVVKVPVEYSYADYIVVATGRSSRHMLAISQFIREIYKKKRFDNDIIPNLEGKNSKNWMALDLGNIVLHVFSKSEREIFDLESLWTVGKEYDAQFKKIESPFNRIMSDYSHLLSKLAPATSNN